MHSALILCEKHLDETQSALVVKRSILQDAVDTMWRLMFPGKLICLFSRWFRLCPLGLGFGFLSEKRARDT